MPYSRVVAVSAAWLVLGAASQSVIAATSPLAYTSGAPSIAATDITSLAADGSEAHTMSPKNDDGSAIDSVAKTRLNKAEGFNALDYIHERRYLSKGDEFGGQRYSSYFVELGVGAEKLDAPTNDYSFNVLTSFHVGVGKQLNGFSSLRLRFHGDVGARAGSNIMLAKAGGQMDYLFNFSSYFDGYNPTRLFEVSSVLGIGGQVSKLRRNSSFEKSFEGHIGVQLKLFTGVRGYVGIEPYIGVSTDQADVSGDKNWRKFDVFYGADFSYVYYLGNNLSKTRRRELIDKRGEKDDVVGDSVLRSWQRPWFMEFATGPHLMKSSTMDFMSTMGHEVGVSVGKWLSPVIGLRFTASLRSATHTEEETESPAPSYDATYTNARRRAYLGGRVDALINPLGFSKHFAWDKPFGFYLLAGGELGRLIRYESSYTMKCYSFSYGVGAHLWARIADGVQLFVEPRGSWYVYNIPYFNDDTRSEWFTDGGLSVNIGLTVSTYDRKYRRPAGNAREQSRFTAGIGGGGNLIHRRSNVEGGGVGGNLQAWAEYNFNRLSAAHLAFEFVSVGVLHSTSFYDYNMAYPSENYLRTSRTGVWKRRYRLGVLSLDYALDLTEALCGYRNRRLFEITAFAGPSLVMLFGERASLYPSERLQEGHVAELARPVDSDVSIGANVGFRLTAHVTSSLGVYLSPSLYVWKGFDLPGVNFMMTKHIESLNLGVQYDF